MMINFTVRVLYFVCFVCRLAKWRPSRTILIESYTRLNPRGTMNRRDNKLWRQRWPSFDRNIRPSLPRMRSLRLKFKEALNT